MALRFALVTLFEKTFHPNRYDLASALAMSHVDSTWGLKRLHGTYGVERIYFSFLRTPD